MEIKKRELLDHRIGGLRFTAEESKIVLRAIELTKLKAAEFIRHAVVEMARHIIMTNGKGKN